MPAGGSAMPWKKPVAICLQWCVLAQHDASYMSRSKPVPGKTMEILNGIWTVGSKLCLQGLRDLSMGSVLWVLFPKQHRTVILSGQMLWCAHMPCPRPFSILLVLLHSQMQSLPLNKETLSHSPAVHSSPNLLNPHWLHSPKSYLLCQLPLLTTSKGPMGHLPFPLLHASLYSCFLLFKAQDGWAQRPSCYWGPWASLSSQKCWFHLLVMAGSWLGHD